MLQVLQRSLKFSVIEDLQGCQNSAFVMQPVLKTKKSHKLRQLQTWSSETKRTRSPTNYELSYECILRNSFNCLRPMFQALVHLYAWRGWKSACWEGEQCAVISSSSHDPSSRVWTCARPLQTMRLCEGREGSSHTCFNCMKGGKMGGIIWLQPCRSVKQKNCRCISGVRNISRGTGESQLTQILPML